MSFCCFRIAMYRWESPNWSTYPKFLTKISSLFSRNSSILFWLTMYTLKLLKFNFPGWRNASEMRQTLTVMSVRNEHGYYNFALKKSVFPLDRKCDYFFAQLYFHNLNAITRNQSKWLNIIKTLYKWQFVKHFNDSLFQYYDL